MSKSAAFSQRDGHLGTIWKEDTNMRLAYFS